MSETQLDMFQEEIDQIEDMKDLKEVLRQMSDRMQGMEKTIAELTQVVKNIDFFKKISDKIYDLEKPGITKRPPFPGVCPSPSFPSYPYPNFPSYPSPLGPHLVDKATIPGFGYREGTPIFTADLGKMAMGVLNKEGLADYSRDGVTLKLKVDPND